MEGDAKERNCEQCSTHVHNMSALGDEEAQSIFERNPSACVRFHYDASGSIVGPPPPSKAIIAGLVVALAAPIAVASFEVDEAMTKDMKEGEVRVAMGGIRIKPRLQMPASKKREERRKRLLERRRHQLKEAREAPEPVSMSGSTQAGEDSVGVLDAPEPLNSVVRIKPERGLLSMTRLGGLLLALLVSLVPFGKSFRRRKRQQWDAWSLPQLSVVAGGLWLAAASNLATALVGGALLGSGLALTRLVRKERAQIFDEIDGDEDDST